MEEKTSISKILAAIVAFWLIFLFGGSLIYIIQQIGMWFNGASQGISSLLGKWVSLVANPLACVIGSEAYSDITDGKANVSLLVNLVIATVLSVLSVVGNLMADPVDVIRTISTALTVVVCIYCTCSTTKKLR